MLSSHERAPIEAKNHSGQFPNGTIGSIFMMIDSRRLWKLFQAGSIAELLKASVELSLLVQQKYNPV